jgi:hypothetical protein
MRLRLPKEGMMLQDDAVFSCRPPELIAALRGLAAIIDRKAASGKIRCNVKVEWQAPRTEPGEMFVCYARLFERLRNFVA